MEVEGYGSTEVERYDSMRIHDNDDTYGRMDVTLSEEGADCGGSESDAYEELNRREFNSGVIDDECCKLEDLA
ncbi:hypothetical protein HN51_030808 [Arachis hypogaea]